ncbi:MAG: DUF6677 family protein [Planctomycetota bacterium]
MAKSKPTRVPTTSSQPGGSVDTVIEVEGTQINLRNRYLAAFLAWLVPGAGHFYQGRHAKGSLYVVCILLTWMIGFSLGGGHVVYASWQPGDKRWHYFLQAGVGAAAMPALIQSERMRRAIDRDGKTPADFRPWLGGFMSPPARPVEEKVTDQVSAWYARRGAGYEMGTWYTMIAGLLNILVIYDAYAGPLSVPISGRKNKKGNQDTDSSGGKDPPD